MAGDMVVTAGNEGRWTAPVRSLTAIVDFAVGTHARAATVLLVVALLSFLPGFFSIPPIDRDEARFAQATKQMIESRDYIDIRYQNEVRYKKPVGIYWLQATATAIAGGGHDNHIWTYRLPSLAGAIAASWLTVWIALAVTGAEGAFLAGLLMLGSVLLTAEATIATTDAVLLACALAVQGVLLRLYRAARDPDAPQPSRRLVVAGWIACAAGRSGHEAPRRAAVRRHPRPDLAAGV